MKKWVKIYIIILGALFVVGIALAFEMYHYEDNVKMSSLLHFIVSVIQLIIAVMFLLCVIIKMVLATKSGLHNVRKCDDALFCELDKYTDLEKESNNAYIRAIQMVNLYYSENERVAQLVSDRSLQRLYVRKDFLQKRIDFSKDGINLFQAFVISVMISMFLSYLQDTMVVSVIAVGILILGFLATVFSKYLERGEFGSYRYMVDESEIKLLTETIECLEKSLTITSDDEKILNTQRIVIHELLKRKKKSSKAKKQEIEMKIQQADELKLTLGNYESRYLREIEVDGEKCYLVYDREIGAEGGYKEKTGLINDDYIMLYQIMNEYGLISEK